MLGKKPSWMLKWTRSAVSVVLPSTLLFAALSPVTLSASPQDAEPRRFYRIPHFTGPDDPERGQIRDTLKLGETVVIETRGARDADFEVGVVPELAPRRNSRPGGPFLIEGIEPGDWVAIHIIDIEVAPYGFVNNGGPFRGHLRSVVPIRDGLIHFPPDFVVPVKPMVGVVQLEPVQQHPGPWNHGGNLDYTSVSPGSIVYIRSQRYGGHLTVGDVHARQGDGELTGTAVEIESAVTLKVERAPSFPTAGPVVETSDRYYASGMGINWDEALKIAWVEAVALVSHLYDITPDHANLIVGTLGDAVPGFVAAPLYNRGYATQGQYVTLQIAITKDLRRTGGGSSH
ncbi:hypothetical protein BH23BAC4_BH23BAC4_12160 [soil metagenome]